MSNAGRSSSSDVLCVDNYSLAEFSVIAAAFGCDRYAYVVTPNVDHIIRYCDDLRFRDMYADALYVLLDSRFLAHWLAIVRNQRVHTCPGSDLTPRLLQSLHAADERIVLVGGTFGQAQHLSQQFGLLKLVHIDPPMGFIHDPEEVERCLKKIEAASPFRYCFLAVGSPQQEIIAKRLKERSQARGLALCVGASINFLTGVERRAPSWMQRLGMEWLFRLLQNPARLGKRYVGRGLRIFLLLPRLRIVPRREIL